MTTRLSTLKLTLRCHLHSRYTGIDSPNKCINKEHFLNYPYEIEYKHNSRGFRGPEWPSNTDNICWCVGDSFTSGVGQPYEHTWPYVLSSKSNIPVINVSMDGASNTWISRKIIELLEIQPKYIIIQWSYVHRRERPIIIGGKNYDNCDEERTLWNINVTTEEDIQHNVDCINLVESKKRNTIIIHTFVPKNAPEGYELMFKDSIEKMNINVVWFEQLDYARDYHHYDILTSTSLVEKIIASKYINI
jgi:hypothetical protein